MKQLLLLTCLFVLFSIQNLFAQNNFVAGVDLFGSPPFQPSNSTAICDTIFSFSTIDVWPSGIAFDGNFIWCNGNASPYIYKYTLSGLVVDSIPSPASGFPPDYGGDMDFDGTNLLVMAEELDTLFKINPNTGTVVSKFRVAPCGGDCFGVAFDGTFIWICDYGAKYLYKLNAATGVVINSFSLGNSSLLPIKFINNELYGLSIIPGMLHKIDTSTGNIISLVPWCLYYPTGFCNINNHLWGVNSKIVFGGTQRIYKFDSLLVNSIGFNILENNSFEILPNPSFGNITIKFPYVVNKGAIEINNVFGAKIFEENVCGSLKKEIYLKNVPSGIYFVKLYDGENRYIKKLIIERD